MTANFGMDITAVSKVAADFFKYADQLAEKYVPELFHKHPHLGALHDQARLELTSPHHIEPGHLHPGFAMASFAVADADHGGQLHHGLSGGNSGRGPTGRA